MLERVLRSAADGLIERGRAAEEEGKLGGIAGDWTATLIGRNLYTWTDYTGFDPEVGITGGTSSTGVINAFDAFRFPNLRTVTFALQASF